MSQRIVDGVEYFFNGVDGQEDAMCARCGSSVSYEDCWDCGGDGTLKEPDDDVTAGLRDCPTCRGRGSVDFCLSSPEWCDAHPMQGREKQEGAGAASRAEQ